MCQFRMTSVSTGLTCGLASLINAGAEPLPNNDVDKFMKSATQPKSVPDILEIMVSVGDATSSAAVERR